MNSEYMRQLLNLYRKSLGIKENDNVKYSDFQDWLNRYCYLTDEYADYEENYGFNLDSQNIYEIDKGYLDSILFRGNMVISPYADTFFETPSILVRRNYDLIIATADKIVPLANYNVIITQNPYDKQLVKDFGKIYYVNGHSIALGVYGYLDDKDRNEKIKMLSDLYDEIIDNYGSSVIYESDVDKDKYFAITVCKKEKSVVKVK